MISRLYAVGGRDGGSCLRTVECYDPYTNKWTSCASMGKRRGGVGVAVMNGYLYAVGGHDVPATNPLALRFNCVERYNYFNSLKDYSIFSLYVCFFIATKDLTVYEFFPD